MTDLERRVDALEQSAAQSNERLVEGVERLAEETTGLNSILHKVDQQQQALAALGRQVEDFEVSKASRADLASAREQQTREALEFRKRTLGRIYLTAMTVALIVGLCAVAVVGILESRRDALRQVCEARSEQNSIIIGVLERSLETDPPPVDAVEVREAIERFRALDRDCEGL